ncbi:hypothetical protein H2248_001022 [Termitomyces sp. 'cryptogamus']|nr:hypothetical protein H2248_001022 [Termitomyces sp. 'cryptogamus']
MSLLDQNEALYPALVQNKSKEGEESESVFYIRDDMLYGGLFPKIKDKQSLYDAPVVIAPEKNDNNFFLGDESK